MSINFAQYLSEPEIKDIAREELRSAIKEHLTVERRVSNLIYDVSQSVVNETLESELGAGWRKKLVARASEIIDSGELEFELFKRADFWEKKPGPAYEPMVEAVKKNTDLIEQRAKELIENMSLDDMGEVLIQALSSRLGGERND